MSDNSQFSQLQGDEKVAESTNSLASNPSTVPSMSLAMNGQLQNGKVKTQNISDEDDNATIKAFSSEAGSIITEDHTNPQIYGSSGTPIVRPLSPCSSPSANSSSNATSSSTIFIESEKTAATSTNSTDECSPAPNSSISRTAADIQLASLTTEATLSTVNEPITDDNVSAFESRSANGKMTDEAFQMINDELAQVIVESSTSSNDMPAEASDSESFQSCQSDKDQSDLTEKKVEAHFIDQSQQDSTEENNLSETNVDFNTFTIEDTAFSTVEDTPATNNPEVHVDRNPFRNGNLMMNAASANISCSTLIFTNDPSTPNIFRCEKGPNPPSYSALGLHTADPRGDLTPTSKLEEMLLQGDLIMSGDDSEDVLDMNQPEDMNAAQSRLRWLRSVLMKFKGIISGGSKKDEPTTLSTHLEVSSGDSEMLKHQKKLRNDARFRILHEQQTLKTEALMNSYEANHLPSRHFKYKAVHGPPLPPKIQSMTDRRILLSDVSYGQYSRYHDCPGGSSTQYGLYLDAAKIMENNPDEVFRKWYSENKKVRPSRFVLSRSSESHSTLANIKAGDKIFNHIPDIFVLEYYCMNPERLIEPGMIFHLYDTCSFGFLRELRFIYNSAILNQTLREEGLADAKDDEAKEQLTRIREAIYSDITETSLHSFFGVGKRDKNGVYVQETETKGCKLDQLVEVLKSNQEFVKEHFSSLHVKKDKVELPLRYLTESQHDFNNRMKYLTGIVQKSPKRRLSKQPLPQRITDPASTPPPPPPLFNYYEFYKQDEKSMSTLRIIFRNTKGYSYTHKVGHKFTSLTAYDGENRSIQQFHDMNKKVFFGLIKQYHPWYQRTYEVDGHFEVLGRHSAMSSIVFRNRDWLKEPNEPRLYVPDFALVKGSHLMEYLSPLAMKRKFENRAEPLTEKSFLEPKPFKNLMKSNSITNDMVCESLNTLVQFKTDTFASVEREINAKFVNFVSLLVDAYFADFFNSGTLEKLPRAPSPRTVRNQAYNSMMEYYMKSSAEIDWGFDFLDFYGATPRSISENRLFTLRFDKNKKSSIEYTVKLEQLLNSRKKSTAKIEDFLRQRHELLHLKLLCAFLQSRYVKKFILRSLLFKIDNNENHQRPSLKIYDLSQSTRNEFSSPFQRPSARKVDNFRTWNARQKQTYSGLESDLENVEVSEEMKQSLIQLMSEKIKRANGGFYGIFSLNSK